MLAICALRPEQGKGTGRDHNSSGSTMWMAGGGVEPAVSHGRTGGLGSADVENPPHVKRLHASLLHLLGFDPNERTDRQAGLDHKLVGGEGESPIDGILAC